MKIKFTKMHACGNDYVYIDAINQTLPDLNKLALFLSNRHFAIGSDGIVLLCNATTPKADYRMRIFNSDGSEAEMCGNGLRSISKYIYEHGFTKKEEFYIETLGGIQHINLTVKDGIVTNISADIGTPILDPAFIPVNTTLETFINQPVTVLDRTFYVTAVGWGNPHIVTFVENTAETDVAAYGNALEHKTDLFPKKTNVSFAQIVDRSHIKLRIWERGAGETLGCGTGTCSTVVASVLNGLCDRTVSVEQPGGTLEITWNPVDDHIIMTGPAITTFESEIEVPTL